MNTLKNLNVAAAAVCERWRRRHLARWAILIATGAHVPRTQHTGSVAKATGCIAQAKRRLELSPRWRRRQRRKGAFYTIAGLSQPQREREDLFITAPTPSWGDKSQRADTDHISNYAALPASLPCAHSHHRARIVYQSCCCCTY